MHSTSKTGHVFSQVPRAEIPRSTFDRSHGHKTTFDAGYLIPVMVDEALPGDTFTCRMTAFARLATPIFPIMDNLYLDSFFFAVPMRLVWSNWQKFNGEQENPGDSTDYVIPQMTAPAGGYALNSMSDYFGLPTGVAGFSHSALFHRAYNLVWNEWFRDQNLQDRAVQKKDNGPDDPADYPLRRRGKRHDYFTSCLPWPQKGPGVQIPLGTTAPVISAPGAVPTFGAPSLNTSSLNSLTGSDTVHLSAGNSGVSAPLEWVNPNLYADLSEATAATINSLRQAFQIQKIFERDARGGTRYTELIRAHFGVVSPDARLQRPEYLGGGSSPVNITPIAQTSETGTTSPQGNLAAMGTSVAHNHGFTASFTEHCIIIGLVCARADLNYQQGINRMFSRKTRFDFYWPALAHIGEQAVLRKEIYTTGVSANDDAVFGYQERFAEYRYKPSQITSRFRSQDALTLDAWHLAQHYTAAPTLGATFIEENPPVKRTVAVTTQPDFLLDTFFSMRCARPMPVYGVPGLIDHF